MGFNAKGVTGAALRQLCVIYHESPGGRYATWGLSVEQVSEIGQLRADGRLPLQGALDNVREETCVIRAVPGTREA
jgi:hypothetical protein